MFILVEFDILLKQESINPKAKSGLAKVKLDSQPRYNIKSGIFSTSFLIQVLSVPSFLHEYKLNKVFRSSIDWALYKNVLCNVITEKMAEQKY